ncbi:hypothetical protein CLOLEP_03879 [[Clostridium] leptum DSM 753]|uniref:Uncharacterized protein n=1 Tax=[Clostridium] leptum DSM 753 TaxID=428125 RepID=A7VZ50_9FIRM|nr:hypothetical protein CLOLEP_03879 [[Clostridium] leptum DSM 753]PEQ25338.1 hypothetical protein CH238_04755 [[Clostridium] leptum DSM 753]
MGFQRPLTVSRLGKSQDFASSVYDAARLCVLSLRSGFSPLKRRRGKSGWQRSEKDPVLLTRKENVTIFGSSGRRRFT